MVEGEVADSEIEVNYLKAAVSDSENQVESRKDEVGNGISVLHWYRRSLFLVSMEAVRRSLSLVEGRGEAISRKSLFESAIVKNRVTLSS